MQTGESTRRITRADVVDRARAFVGTPFLHQGRRLGQGVDCVGLILSVAEDLGLEDRSGIPFKRNDYFNYGVMPVERFVHDECRKRLEPKKPDAIRAGDVVSMRVPHLPTHTAFIAERGGVLYMIHAYSGGESKVVEHVLSDGWRRRIVGAFSFAGVE